MGTFTNTTHKKVINGFVEATKEMLKNPYYAFSSLKATITDYYNLNGEKTTLDENIRSNYDTLSNNSPLRFNLIKDFFLYGIERITYNIENGDTGVEGTDITGDAVILPNTITPYAGDYFKIMYLNKQYLFMVTEVQPDTLDNGSNCWKLSYILERTLDSNQQTVLDELTVDKYVFNITNEGTKFKTIIKESDYTVLERLDFLDTSLKLYFKELFYSEAVQTFVYSYSDVQYSYMYDDFMIEFLIRNDLMKNDGNGYININHKLKLPTTFSIDYADTFYRSIETREKDDFVRSKHECIGTYIDSPISIFSSTSNNYYSISYNTYELKQNVCPVMVALPDEVINAVNENKLFDVVSPLKKYNILIKYFNNGELTASDIDILENIAYKEKGYELFFLIPVLIYCIEFYIKELLI